MLSIHFNQKKIGKKNDYELKKNGRGFGQGEHICSNSDQVLKLILFIWEEISKKLSVKEFYVHIFYMSEPLRAYYGTLLPSVIFFDRPKKFFGCVSDL